jgi:hypothetical protein
MNLSNTEKGDKTSRTEAHAPCPGDKIGLLCIAYGEHPNSKRNIDEGGSLHTSSLKTDVDVSFALSPLSTITAVQLGVNRFSLDQNLGALRCLFTVLSLLLIRIPVGTKGNWKHNLSHVSHRGQNFAAN